jgi:repressor LexA
MKLSQTEDKLKSRIRDISAFYHQKHRMPSFSEIGEMFRLSSKSSVHKVVGKLETIGVISKDKKGRLIPGSIKSPVKILGSVEAGFPSPAEEDLIDTLSLDDLLIQNRRPHSSLRSPVTLCPSCIFPGTWSSWIGQTQSGDIVIAEVDGAWTMKYLRKRGESVTLIPANPNYKSIRPRNELKVAGVVTAVVRKYR